jgi:hypothetical protein
VPNAGAGSIPAAPIAENDPRGGGSGNGDGIPFKRLVMSIILTHTEKKIRKSRS